MKIKTEKQKQKIENMTNLTMAFAVVYTKKKHAKKVLDIDLINDMAKAALKVLECGIKLCCLCENYERVYDDLRCKKDGHYIREYSSCDLFKLREKFE